MKSAIVFQCTGCRQPLDPDGDSFVCFKLPVPATITTSTGAFVAAIAGTTICNRTDTL